MALCGLAKISQYRLPSSWWWGVNLWKYVDQLRERFLQTNMQGLKTRICQNACLIKRDWNVFWQIGTVILLWISHLEHLETHLPSQSVDSGSFSDSCGSAEQGRVLGTDHFGTVLIGWVVCNQSQRFLLKFAFHLSNLRVTFKRLTWILWSRLGTVAKWTVSYVAGRSAGTPSGAPLTQPRSKPINRKKGSFMHF